jgi:hypothetical protein
MIISHQHKFIFIKTKKTAGTSVEIALSAICGDDDIITPITAEDEITRQAVGGRGPQNHVVNGIPLFYNHIPARDVRALIGAPMWDEYFKFCFERNPWDKVISWYFWEQAAEPRLPLSEFIQSGWAAQVGGPGGFDLYTIDGQIAVDRVCRYENLDGELARIRDELKLPALPDLPRAKARFRQDRRHYREILGATDAMTIANHFAREIAAFGYRF